MGNLTIKPKVNMTLAIVIGIVGIELITNEGMGTKSIC
jgi:hypothetical protein